MNWHPYAEEFPLIKDTDPEAWKEFVAGIKATKGNKEDPAPFRIVNGEVEYLDGRNRYFACKEARVKFYSKKVRVPEEKVNEFIDQRNVRRRHMTPEARKALVMKYRAEGQSLRVIADKLNVHHSTVAADVKEAGVGNPTPDAQIPSGKQGVVAENAAPQVPATTTGKDGKAYAATRSKIIPEVQDRLADGRLSPRVQKDFEELTHKQQAEAVRLIDGGMHPRKALDAVVQGDAGTETTGRKKRSNNGRVVYDWKKWEQAAAVFYALPEKLAKAYPGEADRPDYEKLVRLLNEVAEGVKGWRKRLAGVK